MQNRRPSITTSFVNGKHQESNQNLLKVEEDRGSQSKTNYSPFCDRSPCLQILCVWSTKMVTPISEFALSFLSFSTMSFLIVIGFKELLHSFATQTLLTLHYSLVNDAGLQKQKEDVSPLRWCKMPLLQPI